MTKWKDQILELRKQGKSYNQICAELGCSKSTVSYHCGQGQKEKRYQRQIKNRKKEHPYKRKIIRFHYKSRKMQQYQKPTFSVDDVIKKFGENPKCYLTGQPIDIYKPRSYNFDHIIPRSRGGDNSIDNLGICTKKANQAKNDMTPDEFINLCKQVLEHHGYKVTKLSKNK